MGPRVGNSTIDVDSFKYVDNREALWPGYSVVNTKGFLWRRYMDPECVTLATAMSNDMGLVHSTPICMGYDDTYLSAGIPTHSRQLRCSHFWPGAVEIATFANSTDCSGSETVYRFENVNTCVSLGGSIYGRADTSVTWPCPHAVDCSFYDSNQAACDNIWGKKCEFDATANAGAGGCVARNQCHQLTSRADCESKAPNCIWDRATPVCFGGTKWFHVFKSMSCDNGQQTYWDTGNKFRLNQGSGDTCETESSRYWSYTPDWLRGYADTECIDTSLNLVEVWCDTASGTVNGVPWTWPGGWQTCVKQVFPASVVHSPNNRPIYYCNCGEQLVTSTVMASVMASGLNTETETAPIDYVTQNNRPGKQIDQKHRGCILYYQVMYVDSAWTIS